jgi:5-methylcytosine-specific restriction endonuclease McrA
MHRERCRRYRQSERGRTARRARAARRRARSRAAFVRDLPWDAVLGKTNGGCAYCGSSENLTLDHVLPLALHGQHEPANLVAACASCNASKGQRHVWTLGLDWALRRWDRQVELSGSSLV